MNYAAYDCHLWDNPHGLDMELLTRNGGRDFPLAIGRIFIGDTGSFGGGRVIGVWYAVKDGTDRNSRFYDVLGYAMQKRFEAVGVPFEAVCPTIPSDYNTCKRTKIKDRNPESRTYGDNKMLVPHRISWEIGGSDRPMLGAKSSDRGIARRNGMHFFDWSDKSIDPFSTDPLPKEDAEKNERNRRQDHFLSYGSSYGRVRTDLLVAAA